MFKMMEGVYHIVRTITRKLWAVSSATCVSSLFIYSFYSGYLAIAVFLLGFYIIFYNAQDLLLYYPNDPLDSRVFVLQPSNYKLPYENIKIPNKDGLMIHMFLIKQPATGSSASTPTMLFFHGNAGNMGQRLPNVQGFYQNLNINILMVEYRGYGLSEGTPSERGLYVDAQCALEYLCQRPDIDRSKIILFGRSLGGAIAIDLASRLEYRTKVWALIVENTFTSIPDMAQVILKWRCLRWLPKYVHKNKYASLEKMGHVVRPTLVICGSGDALVPPSMAESLHSRCGSIHKKLAVIPQGGHDDTWTCREYYSTVRQFVDNLPPMPISPEAYYDSYTVRDQPSKHSDILTV